IDTAEARGELRNQDRASSPLTLFSISVVISWVTVWGSGNRSHTGLLAGRADGCRVWPRPLPVSGSTIRFFAAQRASGLRWIDADEERLHHFVDRHYRAEPQNHDELHPNIAEHQDGVDDSAR